MFRDKDGDLNVVVIGMICVTVLWVSFIVAVAIVNPGALK